MGKLVLTRNSEQSITIQTSDGILKMDFYLEKRGEGTRIRVVAEGPDKIRVLRTEILNKE